MIRALLRCVRAWSLCTSRSLLVEVFGGNVVLRNLPGTNFGYVGIGRAFDAADHFGLERLSFFDQLFHAFRPGICDIREPLGIARLTG